MTARSFVSDKALKTAIANDCPGVSFRYVAEWNEYQVTPTGSGPRPDYDRPETAFIDKGHDPQEYDANRAELYHAARMISARVNIAA